MENSQSEQLASAQSPQSDSTSNTPQPSTSSNSLNVTTLGYFLDGWADLIEGMGDKVEEVMQKTLDGLKSREMPDITTEHMEAYDSQLSGSRRKYTINKTSPGATTTIYIGKHGKDLYTSWRTFIRPVLNLANLLTTLVICAVLSLIISNGGFVDAIGMTFVLSIFALTIMAVAGRVIRGNFFAFFFIEPSLFDAEDITAMSLSAHKSLLRALDSTGIDISKLRLKQNFRGGRRGEDI